MSGVELIAAERERQITEEGWSPEHDDIHDKEQMRYAAVSYVAHAGSEWSGGPPFNWPWHPDWWKPTGDAVRDLTKAGALIAAEIDRLQRVGRTDGD